MLDSDLSSSLISCKGCGTCITSHTPLLCPKCVSYDYDTFWCSQECLNTNWASHKKLHAYLKEASFFSVPKLTYPGPIRPAYVTPRLDVPNTISKPDYSESGIPHSEQTSPDSRIAPIYTNDEIDGIRAACHLARLALDHAAWLVRPGITTDEIDKSIHNFIISHGAYPSPLNYYEFPKSICTSINEVICHGIPDLRILQDGDIINLDVTVYLNGFHGDVNETHIVGSHIPYETKRLVKATYDCTMAAVNAVKPGVMFRDFGEVIARSSRRHGFSLVKGFCAHGIGHLFHCAPSIPHYSRNKAVGMCKPGMVFTLEPMLNQGTDKTFAWADNWTYTTADGKLSAQFEHTVLTTTNGVEILTARGPTSRPYWWEEPQYASDLERYNNSIDMY